MAVAIYGTGVSPFGRQPATSPSELVWKAVLPAIEEAAVDVDAVFVGSAFGEMGVGQRTIDAIGLVDVPVVRVENACASGTTAFHLAHAAIAAQQHEHALVLGVEHMSAQFSGAIPPEPLDAEGASGMALPAIYAMAAARYQACHGTTDEQLAAVAVKNRAHGAHNPIAQRRGPVTLAEVLASRMIADPLTRLQCSDVSDGAAAIVLGPARGAGDVRVRASVLRSGARWDHRSEHVWGFDLVAGTGRAAAEQAGVALADADLLEVHDAFTIGEIVTTEALGLAEVGAGGALAESGATAIGGATPVNPSGGLLSRGHPLGATGVAQLVEVADQLRGRAGGRQVEGARIGVVETMGGGVSGRDGNACVVAVLEGGGR